ncbi:MAG: ATP-dependent DNA helicase [Deltaproteobacteria bacterium]|nr:ATP-dependent DNA helicase [Deltaproteobacteria bacterium]MBW2344439.1 ATP-dependent DNA helicase [Deltaproteobacteria bacterium]
MAHTSLTIEDILGPDGMLARSLEGFEFRNSQMQMALLIQEALQEKTPAIMEAGTGTGKTFGYLVPLILSQKKGVISTGTKNLQEQVFFKDLPLLEKATGLKIDAIIMKGRKNYLCLHRYHQYFAQTSLLETATDKTRQGLEAWLGKTLFADRAELPWLADNDTLWDALSSTSDQCLGADCKFLNECFLSRLRSKAAKSKIIIVNHHLFFADMKVKRGGFGEIIPRFQVAVFDEAHSVEEVATSFLGETLSTNQLTELVNDLEKETKDSKDIDRDKLKKHLNTIRTGVERLRILFNDRGDKGRLDNETLSVMSKGPAREIRQGLKYIHEKTDFGESDNASLEAMPVRARDMEDLLDQILERRDSQWLNWYEKRKRSLVLHASPLDISGRMNELLYEKVQGVVFTSATLSTNRTFDYISTRLGISDALEGIYPSHFDFKTQTLMYIPRDLPPPNAPDFALEVARRVMDILKMTHGRALVLFTSYHNLNLVHQIMEGRIPYTIYRQGDAPRSVLLEGFRRDIHSVLLATGSFWQGVDVPGESLSCLIIDKLPFDSPGEPLIAARIDAIRDQGGNPFMEYQVPSAIISLKQGLGRLIRKNSDRGILSVLDTRIVTSRYGRFFLDSLPEIPVSHELSDIGRFFK